MSVTKALPQDVAFLAFVPFAQASVLLTLRFRRKINFAVPTGSLLVAKGANRQHEHSPPLHSNQLT
ncbi:hypothetical protein MHH37_02660 [Solibacillus sp. FSL K6-1781]|uniref:hypothetical protein n=1 Tax=Solibacillus sp. FSL K6-1781 TaxID=2921474 RepID=UPI00315A3D55